MSLLSQFNSAVVKEEKTPKQKSGETRSARVQAEYEKHFGAGSTVAAACAAMGIGHVACLNQVYRYERRNLMHRKTQRDTENGGIIFAWGPK